MLNLILYALAGLAALALIIALYLRWQASIPPEPYDVMFAVAPIRPEDEPVVRAARRIPPLEGALNFRDLGGYAAADGRRVAWGKVYRSGELNGLTERDLRVLQERGIRLVCDLRSYPEIRKRPEQVPAGIAYHHIPVFTGEPVGSLHALLMRHRLDALMRRLYHKSIVDDGAPALGRVLRLAADPANLPMVLHCTTGKDRTGVACALLLHVCGIPRDMIVADYSLTSLASERILAGLRATMDATVAPPGVRLEQLYPLLSARPELIERALAYIEAQYGSVDAYLREPVGLTAEDIAAIRLNILT